MVKQGDPKRPKQVLAEVPPAPAADEQLDTAPEQQEEPVADPIPEYVAAWSTANSQFTPFIDPDSIPSPPASTNQLMAYYKGKKYLTPALATFPNNFLADWNALHYTIESDGAPNPTIINLVGAQGGRIFMVQSGAAPRA